MARGLLVRCAPSTALLRNDLLDSNALFPF